MSVTADSPNYGRSLRDTVLLLGLLCSAGCQNPSTGPADRQIPERTPVAALSTNSQGGKIYFVPVGEAPASQIDNLVAYYREKFQLDSQVLPAMRPDADDVDFSRQQLIAEKVIQSVLRHYPQYAGDKSAVLIAITSQDMFPLGAHWQFCFGWRIPAVHAAVVSTARMDLHYPGEPPTEATLEKRLRKVVSKDVGILYYGKTPNDNPRSVLYSNILGIQELDQVSEDF